MGAFSSCREAHSIVHPRARLSSRAHPMELAFDIIMDPSQSQQAARLRPGQPVTPSMLDIARRKLEEHSKSEIKDGLPPWRILSERFSILEPELKDRCLSISRLNVLEFLEPLQSQEWSNYALSPDLELKLQALLPPGVAALTEDPALARLRSALVPARASETAFFFCYFVHVKRHRRDVLPPMAQVISSEEDWENFLTSPLHPPSPSPSLHVSERPAGSRCATGHCTGTGATASEGKPEDHTHAASSAVQHAQDAPTAASVDDDFDDFLNSSI